MPNKYNGTSTGTHTVFNNEYAVRYSISFLHDNHTSIFMFLIFWVILLLLQRNRCTEATFSYDKYNADLKQVLQQRYSVHCDWGYHCATSLTAVLIEQQLGLNVSGIDETTVQEFLETMARFPQYGFWVFWLPWFATPGDRVGLFGGLYNEVNDSMDEATTITQRVDAGLLAWPKRYGVFIRIWGWGFPILGIDFLSRYIWADDAFVGGYPLIHSYPEVFAQMILDYDDFLHDPNDGLWLHGARLRNSAVVYNGIKWGRANGWMLLAVASYVLRSSWTELPQSDEITDMLLRYLNNILPYQRESGAFGNIIDLEDSPDESSLTNCFLFAVGVAVRMQRNLPSSRLPNEPGGLSARIVNTAIFGSRKRPIRKI